jgi:hypothetical protein
MAIVLVFSAILISPSTALAASPTYTGAQFYASAKVNTRTSLSGSDNGYIAANDLCKVVSTGHMQGGAEYWYINYPVSGGTKNAYALKSAFVTVTPYVVTVPKNTNVYKTNAMSGSTFGTAYTTDLIYVLSKSGNNVWIIYPVTGGYKIGWTSASNVNTSGSSQPGVVRVTGVSVNTKYIEIGIGQTYQWVATVTPDNATNKKITYSLLSLTSVATISSTGLVTGKTAGLAYITAKTDDSGLQVSAVVSVKSTPTNTESPAWVSTVSAKLNIRSAPSISASVIGHFTSKQVIVVYSEKDGFYSVKGTNSDNGATITGYGSTAYITLGSPPPTPSPSSDVAAKLAALRQTYPNGTYWTINGAKNGASKTFGSSIECKGFAKLVFDFLYKTSPGPTKSNYYEIELGLNMVRVDQIGPSGISVARVKELFSKAQPGDFIQISHWRSSNAWGPHSMIFLSSNSNGIYVLDCNSDGHCMIKWENYYAYSVLCGSSTGRLNGITLLSYKP